MAHDKAVCGGKEKHLSQSHHVRVQASVPQSWYGDARLILIEIYSCQHVLEALPQRMGQIVVAVDHGVTSMHLHRSRLLSLLFINQLAEHCGVTHENCG